MMIRLKATVNSYDWGKASEQSLVARYAKSGSDMTDLDPNLKYSELWVGTHPNGPSSVFGTGESLKHWLGEHPQADLSLGEDGGLCFLFKILSIGKALSIQAHPNQKRARELFATRPDLYKDPNHKPEMACALTPFEALLGFQSIERIVFHVEHTPELLGLVSEQVWRDLRAAAESIQPSTRRAALKDFFSQVLSSDPKQVALRVDELVTRLLTAPPNSEMDHLNTLALRLHEEFPHDVGIFCAYIMCYEKLSPGDAVFLTSNEPHAYLSGECVEVMANSDNVIRAALTPKFKDLDELNTMLTYNEPQPDNNQTWHPRQILRPTKRDSFTVVFTPPDAEVWEFQLERTTLGRRNPPYKLAASQYTSVLFVTEGQGKLGEYAVVPGAAFLLPAGQRVLVSGELVLYRVTRKA
ncbi:mannose-6-phosphate isomerase, class I [Batrachochytrium salamandrivorans]|nr:mannose-6-phosphate isomerase, class I [Batrachochytrium salamandrivorans]